MTVDSDQRQGSLIGHVVKRILLALFGYLVALVVGLLAIVMIYSFLSYMPGLPSYFTAMSLAPLAMLYIPPLWIFTLLVAAVATAVPAVIAMLGGEIFGLRNTLVYMVLGAGVALLGYASLTPHVDAASHVLMSADTIVIVGAGLISGFVYWLVAGRDAGFRRRL